MVNVISDTIQEFNGERFYRCGNYFQHKGKRLHRAVWEFFNGEIPDGYHVHHIDEDRSHNDISNLRLMEGSEHLSKHMHSEKAQDHCKRVIKLAQEAAKEWHSSPDGLRWHSEHMKKIVDSFQPLTWHCDMCGKEYSTKLQTKVGHHFCSNNCKAKYRRWRLAGKI